MLYRFLSFILMLSFFCACSKKESDSNSDIPKISSGEVVIETPIQQEQIDIPKLSNEGKVLVESADCLSCHHPTDKMIGPSYSEVAEKYSEADLEYLSNKIIEGGSGVWGDVPMAAHNGLSKENSRKMVYYILSLKN